MQDSFTNIINAIRNDADKRKQVNISQLIKLFQTIDENIEFDWGEIENDRYWLVGTDLVSDAKYEIFRISPFMASHLTENLDEETIDILDEYLQDLTLLIYELFINKVTINDDLEDCSRC